MLSPYRIYTNITNKRSKNLNTEFNNNQHLKHDIKRPQMTSNDPKRPQSISESSPKFKTVGSKNKLRGGYIEINDEDLDEILHNNIF